MDGTEPVVPTEPVTTPEAGNEDATSAPVTDSPEAVAALKADLAAANKRAEQAEMERNLRRKEAEQAKVKALEEADKYKEANDELKRQIEEADAEKTAAEEKKQTDTLRDKVISEYPTEVQEIARDLNLFWDNAATTYEAETQLKTKLDAIKSRIGQVDEDGSFTPRVSSNNPGPQEDGLKLEDMTAIEMKKHLPVAPPR